MSVCTLLILGITLSKTALIIATLIWSAIIYGFFDEQIRETNILSALAAIVLIAAALFFSSSIYDSSYDGQTYHYKAILSLADGWNPFRTPEHYNLWVKHYAKGAWLTGSYLYILSGKMEMAKAVGLLAMIASLFYSYFVLSTYVTKVPKIVSGILAVLVACSPVTMGQLFTFYIDGVLASFLIIYAMSLIVLYWDLNKRIIFLASIALIFLVNLKFTAIAYVGLFSIFYFLFLIIQKRFDQLRKSFISLLIAGIFGVLIIGFNPYVTNTLSNGHPFYPLAGKGKVDIMTKNSPGDFLGANRFENFVKSITSKTDIVANTGHSERKNMYEISKQEFKSMGIDTRIAGFGPLFYATLFTSFLLYLCLWIFNRKNALITTFILTAVMATVFINPECWWARYVPQLWLIPVVVIAATFYTKKWLAGIGASIVGILLIVNTAGSDYYAIKNQVDNNKVITQQFESLKGKELIITEGIFVSVQHRLQENNIPFTVTTSPLKCSAPKEFFSTDVSYCKKK